MDDGSSGMIFCMNALTMHDVVVERMAYGGDGLARLVDGRVVFIPAVIPGEKVSVRVVDDKQKYARAEAIELLAPSAERVSAPCPHFGVCGGCQYQHIQYHHQLRYKQDILREQLARLAHLDNVGEITVFPSDLAYGYRNVLQFHPLPGGRLGFMKRNSNAVFEVTRCLLPGQTIQSAWSSLILEPGSEITRVELRQNCVEELLVTLEGMPGNIPEIEVSAPVNMVHCSGGATVVLSGQDALTMWVRDVPFQLSAGSFFQVNDGVAESMVSYIATIVQQLTPKKVLDLYCGVGLFSRFIAPLVDELVAVESDPHACRDFAVNLDAFDNVSLYEGSAETIMPGLPFRADLVLCDPPRAGLHAHVIDALVHSGVTTLIYVSCDPATLARDVQRLGGNGFGVEKIALFDMFPQTYHFETVALLRAAGKE